MKIEIGHNLSCVLNNCLDKIDNEELDSFFSSLKEFMKSGKIQGLEIDISESEGGSCQHFSIRKKK